MRIRYLETFVVVADELHFGRAATRLRVAQPAVSQTVAALEEEVGALLFDRSRRRISLTPAGEVFLAEARGILEHLGRAADLARQAASGERGKLVIGFTTVCALSDITLEITRFIRDHPQVEVRLEQLGTREQIEALTLGRLDLGFSVLPDEAAGLDTRLVAPDELHVFLPSGHRLAALVRVPVAELVREPALLMTRAREPAVHRAFARLCRQHDLEPNIVLELDHLDAMLAFVAAGLGISLAPSVASRLQLDGVVSRPVTPTVAAGVTAMWRSERMSPTCRRFLEHTSSRA